MTTRRNFIRTGTLTTAGLTISGLNMAKGKKQMTAFRSKRPEPSKRNFTSHAVEKTIQDTIVKIKDPKLAWMFENCFPNTLDTTVEYGVKDGRPDTFVITGDINAMWLRDSSAQVWPYLPLVNQDSELKALLAGVINRQTQCILFDPYANAFNKDKTEKSEWMSDLTDMKPGLHERKWEIDSLCYPVRLAWHFWKRTGDNQIFDDSWKQAAELILETFRTQQRKHGIGSYKFERKTTRQLDTLSNGGYGRPLKPVGLINSAFRPSDDATTFGFLVPSNLFAVTTLKQLSDITKNVYGDEDFAQKCEALAAEVKEAILRYAVVEHPKYGKVFSFEVDGFGNATFMDDSNVPSLLALPYLGCIEPENDVYQNTRKLVWGDDNPYFFRGKVAEGIGGPHIGYDMVWPMSIIVRAMTSVDDDEIRWCVRTLRDTDGETGFMHESFHKDNPTNYTRPWFAWANTLFGELILELVNEGKMKCLE